MVRSLLVDVENVLWDVVNTHTLSNVIVKILKHDKIWGQLLLVSPTPNSEDESPCTTMIYAHVYIMRWVRCVIWWGGLAFNSS